MIQVSFNTGGEVSCGGISLQTMKFDYRNSSGKWKVKGVT
jgi:hypothetical protein